MAGPRFTLPRLNMPVPPAIPAPKVPGGAAPPTTIAGLAGPMAPSADARKYEPVKNTTLTNVYSYLTRPTGLTELFYSANERDWVKITLTLQTAGPVNIGISQDISPVGSGKGIDLPTGVPMDITLAPSQRLYIVANTVDRVSTVVAPYPWLWQLLSTVERVVMAQGSIAGGVASAIARMLRPKNTEGR